MRIPRRYAHGRAGDPLTLEEDARCRTLFTARSYEQGPCAPVVCVMQLAFGIKARFYTSNDVIDTLRPVTEAPTLAVVIDVDALEQPVDRVTVLALQSLARARVHVVLLSHDEQTRLSLLRRGIPFAWISADRPRHAIPHVRQHVHGARIIAIAMDTDTGSILHSGDCGISARGGHIRALLWWLVQSRAALRI